MRDAKWHEPAQDHHLDMFLLFVCLTHISHGTAHFILSGASALPYSKRAKAQAHYFELCVQELTGRVIIVIVMMRRSQNSGFAKAHAHFFEPCAQELTGRVIIVIVMMRAVRKTVDGPRPTHRIMSFVYRELTGRVSSSLFEPFAKQWKAQNVQNLHPACSPGFTLKEGNWESEHLLLPSLAL